MSHQNQIETRTDELLEKIYRSYPNFRQYHFRSYIELSRAKHIAAAYYGENKIVYNKKYTEVDIDFILKEVVPHEIAHLLARFLYGQWIRSHGREWRKLAQWLGSTGKACAASEQIMAVADANRNNRKRYEYQCGTHTFTVSAIMHNKIKKGQKRRHIASGLPVTIANFTGRVVIH